MRRYRLINIFVFILFFLCSKIGMAGTELDGSTKVCEDVVYTYEIDPGFGVSVKPGTSWSITGGRIVESSRKKAKVLWEGTGTHKISVRAYLANGFGGHWHKDMSKTVSYKDLGTLDGITIKIGTEPQEYSSFCVGEALNLTAENTLNSDYDWTFYWYRYINNAGQYLEDNTDSTFSYTTTEEGLLRYLVFAVDETGCKLKTNKYIYVKSNQMQNVNMSKIDPTCHDGRNTIIQVSGVPDYRQTNLYKNKNNLEDGNIYAFTASEYGISNETECFEAIQNVEDDSDLFSGLDLCLTGYTANAYRTSYDSDYTLDENDFTLEFQGTNPPPDIEGLGAGYYVVTLENPYFCTVKKEFDIIQPQPFKITDIDFMGEYSYGATTYNITTNTGTDQIRLTMQNGNGNPVTYYSDDTVITTSNLTSEIILSGINGQEQDIYAIDGDGCKSNTRTIDLVEPEPFEIDTESSIPPDCHTNNDGTKDNGKYYITVKGGIGEYTLDYGGSEVDKTNFSDPNNHRLEFTNTANTYTVQVSDIAQTIEKKITIPEPAELDFDIVDMVTSECAGFNDGELTVVPKSRVEDAYEYSIRGGTYDVIYSPTGDKAYYTGLGSNTTYDLEVTVKRDVGNIECTEYGSHTFTGFADPLGFNIVDTIHPLCFEGIDGKIILDTYGGHQDGNYDASNFSVTSSFAPSVKNQGSYVLIDTVRSLMDYEVTIEDDEGCSTSEILNIAHNQNPVQFEFLDSAEIQCNNYDNGWIKLAGYGGLESTHGYDYYLFPEYEFYRDITEPVDIDTSIVKYGSEVTFYNLAPGIHDIYVADSNDCLHPDIQSNESFYKKSIHVYEPPIIEVNHDNSGVSQKGESDAWLWFKVTGGNYSFIYQLECADTIVKSGSTIDSIMISDLAEGVYTLKIKDTCDCSNKPSMEWMFYEGIIVESPNEYLSLHVGNVKPVSCYGGSDGGVTIYGEGGWEDYTFGVDSVDKNKNGIFEHLTSGWHLFHVKDSANVTVYDSIYIPQPEKLKTTIKNILDVTCHNGFDGEVSLTITGGTKPYLFSLDRITWQQDSVFTELSQGHYNFYVQDAHGCEASVEADVNHPAPFSVSYNITETLCGESNGRIECQVTGATSPYSFEWSDGNQVIGTDSIIDNLHSGEYGVTISDVQGCDTSFVLVVTNTDGPQIGIDSVKEVSCKGDSDGGIYYQIEHGVAPFRVKLFAANTLMKDTTISEIGAYVFSHLAAASYKIIIYDVNDCLQSIDEIVVEEPNRIMIGIDTLLHPLCHGYRDAQIKVSASGGNGTYRYEWNTGNQTNHIQNLESGTYQVTATDWKGCSIEESYKLADPEKLTVSLGDDATICEGQTYPLSAEGFSTYNWVYNGESISSAPDIEVWSPGEYHVQVTDEKGCIAKDSFVLSISNDLLEAEFLMPSEAFENDTVVAIDISWPEPENITWSFDPGIVNIESDDFMEMFTFESPGTYTISLTSFKAMCIDSVSKNIIVMADTTGHEKSLLGENSIIQSFKVYPNPNNGEFSVEIDLDYASDIRLDLFNVQQSRVVLRQKSKGQSYYKMEYGFTNLQQGVYLVILYVENEKRTERVLIF